MDSRILYLTFDGVLEPLGFGQVARVVMGLASRGWPYELVSLERPDHLADISRVDELRRVFSAAHVNWTPLPYRVGGRARGVAMNLLHPTAVVTRLVKQKRVTLVHARSYQAALVAQTVKRLTGVPYLFDTRGYWFDERREQGRWLENDAVFRAAKLVERSLYKGAAGAVSLTQLGADDMRGGVFGRWRDRPVAAIPTCVDQTEFTLEARTPRHRFDDKLVIGWVGSINNWYHIDAGLDLFKRIRARRDDAHLLWLTPQVEAAETKVREAGVDAAERTVIRAHHHEMPAWMGTIDWGLLLLVESYAKRASMPTKLGEFLAAGVRPIHHGCNAEVGEWIKRTGSGLTLQSLDDAALERAADHVATVGRSDSGLEAARTISADHFSLATGVDRYAALLDQIESRTAPSSSSRPSRNRRSASFGDNNSARR